MCGKEKAREAIPQNATETVKAEHLTFLSATVKNRHYSQQNKENNSRYSPACPVSAAQMHIVLYLNPLSGYFQNMITLVCHILYIFNC